MSNEETRDKIAEVYMSKQEKYIYYILALNVASIGFSISQVIDLKINYILIPVATAIIFWSLSFYCGIKFIHIILETHRENVVILDLDIPSSPTFLNRVDSSKIVNENLQEMEIKNSNRSSNFFKWQLKLFYFGGLSIILWVFIKILFNS